MGHLTFFVAPLTCMHCGRTAPADVSTGMSNHLSSVFGGEVLRVGDRRDFRPADFAEAFLLLREPAPGEPTRILHDWVCPYCDGYNWAEVVFADGTLHSITAVPFDREAVARAHYISERIAEYYESVTGQQLWPNYDGNYRRLIEELLQRPADA